MLTFTHTVDSLSGYADMHSYTLKGDYIDIDGNIVHVAEYSANLPRMLKTLEYYIIEIEGDEIVYETIVNKSDIRKYKIKTLAELESESSEGFKNPD